MASVKELFTIVRQEYLDDISDVSTSWMEDDTDYLWSNNELLGYLNEAKNEFCRRNPIHDSTSSICSIAITGDSANHQVLSYSNRILRIKQAKIASEDYPLEHDWSIERLNDLYPTWRTVTATPLICFQDISQLSLTLVGILSDNDTLNLAVERLPLVDEIWTEDAWTSLTAADGVYRVPTTYNGHYYLATTGGTTDSSEPTWPVDGSTVADADVVWTDQGLLGNETVSEIIPHMHRSLCDYMAHLAYKKQDSEIFSIKDSSYFGKEFTKKVGPPKNFKQQERDRRMGSARRRSNAEYR